MTKITLQSRVIEWSHMMVLTHKFENNFGLPEKVTDYFAEQFKKEKALGKKGKKVLNYNYIGKSICIITVDQVTDKNLLQEELRKHGCNVADAVNGLKGTEVFIFNQTNSTELSLFAAEGVSLGNYQFIKHKSNSNETKNTLQTIVIANSKLRNEKVEELNTLCEATKKARDLVNEPVNVLNASALSKAFANFGKEAGFTCEILSKKEITKLGMGGLLAVNAGSVDEPTFTIMTYHHARAKNKQPIVLIGKGVVYDTGGLSLKPTANSMDMMKCDMAGAAAVGAAIYAIAKSKLKVNVIALVPATDNRPGFNAFAPGDIIKMMDGSTVEMLNSDAEGRMILADALHFAKKYKPLCVIDIATLTGAAAAAIGTAGIVGMGKVNEKIRQQLISSGSNVHERIAEFPFWDDYDDLLKSDIADQKNLGGPYAGAITAGKFLSKFTDYPYYHLDIAGPAFLTAKESYRGKGGTGVGVRLFYDFLKNF